MIAVGRRELFGSFLLLLATGCAPKIPHVTSQEERHLAHSLIVLDRSVDPHEARKLAQEALNFSRTLAVRYRVDTTPWVHNFLVNIHLKERGLCYQWADDLLTDFHRLHLRTLRILPVGANIGSYWSEHNALVVLPTRRAVPLKSGILLDAWRYSGKLFFVPVGKDSKYSWQVRWARLPKIAQGQVQ